MRVVPPVPSPRFVAIFGYGAPPDPLQDDHLTVYLDAVTRSIGRPRQHDEIFLMGGCTNRTDLSEAEAMRRWFAQFEPTFLPHLVSEDTPITARESVWMFAQEYGEHGPEVELMIFCEYSRRWMIRMLVKRFLPGRKVWVRGIKFDEAALTRTHRLYQVGPRLAFEWLALRRPFFNQMHNELRARYIANARAETAAEQERA